MKNNIKYFLFICITAVLLNACTPDKDFSIGTPANRISQLSGTWKLQTVTQTDLSAQNNNFVDPARPDVNLISQDVTAAAAFTDITLAFMNDANGPTTFNINYGAAPPIFRLSSGNWNVDNLQAPGVIKFINGADTTNTTIGGLNNLASNMLTLSVIRYQGVKAVTRYNYNFSKN